jgi:hypothetical protein
MAKIWQWKYVGDDEDDVDEDGYVLGPNVPCEDYVATNTVTGERFTIDCMQAQKIMSAADPDAAMQDYLARELTGRSTIIAGEDANA